MIPLFLVKEKGMSIEMANTIFGIFRTGGFIIVILVGIFFLRIVTAMSRILLRGIGEI